MKEKKTVKKEERKKTTKKQNAEKNNVFKWLTLIFAVLFLATVIYVLIGNYQQAKIQQQQAIYISGAQQGSEDTIMYLFEQGSNCNPTPIIVQNTTMTMLPLECVFLQATTCEPYPLTFGNVTVNMIAAECLQQTN
ncbi:hypothetical protein K9L97_03685 [Candidatus Woesearchaeota archaeon]|nr:hypothetical protein [Candidatus Woesearchaeota archaeon]